MSSTDTPNKVYSIKERTTREKDALYLQIEELRGALSAGERSATRREEQLRRERDDLLARLEQSENRLDVYFVFNCWKVCD